MTETSAGILTIDLDAVQANYDLLNLRLSGPELAAVVKADAYGLGLGEVAPALARAGCTTFFVATLQEGIELRAILKDADIHIFNGADHGEGPAFIKNRLVPVLNSPDQLNIWTNGCARQNEHGRADLHVDTGLSRLGLTASELSQLSGALPQMELVDIDVVMSHLACADQPDHPMNLEQKHAFDAAVSQIGSKRKSLASSSGIFLGPQYHYDLARAGAALYGVNPHPGAPNPMRQVVRIQGKILQVRSVDTPTSVGYGATHRATRPSKIATVAVGYADGYFRSLSNAGTAFVGDYEIPLVGRVSMDLTTFDVTDIPAGLVAPGQMVDLVGPKNPIDKVAGQAGTIGYEMLTNLGMRYQRVYSGGGRALK